MSIIGPYPYSIANGQVIDAVPVMSDFNWIMNQVNANAVALADLASASAGLGASLVGINDSEGWFTATNVEGALAAVGHVVSDKTAAKAIPVVASRAMFITSNDGGQFVAKTGAAPSTYVENGGAYCGTIILPTGGNGSSAWVRSPSEAIDVRWFGAVGDGVTVNTTAFTNAQNAAPYVEVPDGTYIVGSGLNYWQFYGTGTVIENGKTWELSRAPQSSQTQKVYRNTWGSYESACGYSVVVNSGQSQSESQTQILGTTTSGVAVYGGFDHSASYKASYSFVSQTFAGTGCTYTATSVTQAGVSGLSINPGMYIQTSHTPWFVGKVQSVSGTTINVDGWYQQTTGTALTPSNGTGGIVNPNTKIWVENTHLELTSTGTANSGTGHELNIVTTKTGSGAQTVGYDVITSSGEDTLAHYRSRGNTTDGYYATNATQAAFHAVQSTTLGGTRIGYLSETAKVGFESSNDTYSFISNNPTGAAQQVNVSGVSQWNIDNTGSVTRLTYKTAAYGPNGTISDDVTFAVALGATINLPANIRGDGQVVKVSNQTGSPVTVNGNTHTISGSASTTIASLNGVEFVAFGGNWLLTTF